MTKPKKPNHQKRPVDNISPTISNRHPIQDSLPGDENSETTHQTSTETESVSEGKKYRQVKLANIIAGIAVCVSIILTVFTFRLFKQASTQTQAANKAAAAAVTADSIANNSYNLSDSIYKTTDTSNRNTLTETKRYNNSLLAAQQNLFTQTKDYNNKLLSAQKDVLIETKNDAIKKDKRDSANLAETKKEFEIENKPIIQILNVKYTTIISGEQIVVKFDLINYGKQPIKCLSNKYKIDFSYFNDFTESANGKWHYDPYNLFLSGGVLTTSTWTSVKAANDDDIKSITNGAKYAYVYGYLYFENMVTFKKETYHYTVKLFYVNNVPGEEAIVDTTYNAK